MGQRIKIVLAYVGFLGVMFGGIRAHNVIFNDRTVITPSYHLESKVTAFTGHINYVRFSDGSQEVKEYFQLGNYSEVLEDLNGDGLTDRIRHEESPLKARQLSELLVRTQDYDRNKSRFDEADRKLQELVRQYASQN